MAKNNIIGVKGGATTTAQNNSSVNAAKQNPMFHQTMHREVKQKKSQENRVTNRKSFLDKNPYIDSKVDNFGDFTSSRAAQTIYNEKMQFFNHRNNDKGRRATKA